MSKTKIFHALLIVSLLIPILGVSRVQAAPSESGICNGPEKVMTILVIGTDTRSAGYLWGLGDTTMLIRVDFQNRDVSIVGFPRDLWVEIPDVLEDDGRTHGKLNQSYHFGTAGMGYFSGSGFGSGLLAETILHNYGFRVDKYLAINLSSFRIIIDTLGGIDVYLDHDVYKRVYDQPELFLKAGPHHLDGKQTEMLARQRISIGDFGRINNQTVILKAVAQKLLSPSGIAAIPAMVDQLKSNVQTDLSPADISQLICLAGMIDFDVDINFTTLPTEMMIEQMVYDPTRDIKTAALVGDEDKIRTILAEFNQGIWP